MDRKRGKRIHKQKASDGDHDRHQKTENTGEISQIAIAIEKATKELRDANDNLFKIKQRTVIFFAQLFIFLTKVGAINEDCQQRYAKLCDEYRKLADSRAARASEPTDQIAAEAEWTSLLKKLKRDGLLESHIKEIDEVHKSAIEKATKELRVDLLNGREIHNAACNRIVELERENARILKDHNAIYQRSRAAHTREQ